MLLFSKLNVSRIKVRSAYGPEGDPPAPAPTPTATPTATPNPTPVVNFTPEQQTKVNTLIAEERRKTETKAQQANQQLITQLEQLQQSKGLTEQEKTDLETRIEELKTQYQTKEEQQRTELQKLQTRYDNDVKKKETESNGWKNRFENGMISVDIRDASIKYKAVSPKQIEAILRPITKMVEESDADGKPTGNLVSRVDFADKDKDGNPVKLSISVDAAVKRMTEIPDEYGNLFETPARAGLGASPNHAGNGRLPNIDQMSVQEYTKNRAKIREEMAKGNT